MTLTELKQKYKIESATHEPNPICKFCHGTGERFVKKANKTTFCICLFLDHKFSDLAGETLSKVVKEILSERPTK